MAVAMVRQSDGQSYRASLGPGTGTQRSPNNSARIQGNKKRPCTTFRTSVTALSRKPDSGQVTLRHPKESSYRCFLPDLTGFAALRRAGPNHPRRAGETDSARLVLEVDFDPAIADCGYRAPLAPRLARPHYDTNKHQGKRQGEGGRARGRAIGRRAARGRPTAGGEGGEGGIRTREGLLLTRFPIARVRPATLPLRFNAPEHYTGQGRSGANAVARAGRPPGAKTLRLRLGGQAMV
jgi:hypothetical protein